MHFSRLNSPTFRRRGFTLIELLVTVVIIIVLAVVSTAAMLRVRKRTATAAHLSSIRQAGMILIEHATENNGRFQYYSQASTGAQYNPYFIVRDALGIDPTDQKIVSIMHWDPKKLKPRRNEEFLNCRAINMTTVEYPDGKRTEWKETTIKDDQQNSVTLKSIRATEVARPHDYPLLVESSDPKGREYFLVDGVGQGRIGLREPDGRTNAVFFDGSVRTVDVAELRKGGFSNAYDNSRQPPKTVSLMGRYRRE